MNNSVLIVIFALSAIACRPLNVASSLAADETVVKAENMANSQYSGDVIKTGSSTDETPSFSVRQYDSTGAPVTSGGNNVYRPADDSIDPLLLQKAYDEQQKIKSPFGAETNRETGEYFLPKNESAGVPPNRIRQNGQWLQKTEGTEDLAYFAGLRNQNIRPAYNPVGYRYTPVESKGAEQPFLADSEVRELNKYYELEAKSQIDHDTNRYGSGHGNYTELSKLRNQLRGADQSVTN